MRKESVDVKESEIEKIMKMSVKSLTHLIKRIILSKENGSQGFEKVWKIIKKRIANEKLNFEVEWILKKYHL